jgi:hypothetical protein
LASGALRVELCMASDVGTVEAAAQNILHDLVGADTGLAIRDGEVGPASDPMPGARAANATGRTTDYRVAVITLNFGLSVG